MIKKKKDEPSAVQVEVKKKKRTRAKKKKEIPPDLAALTQVVDNLLNNNATSKPKSPKKRKLYTPLIEGNF